MEAMEGEEQHESLEGGSSQEQMEVGTDERNLPHRKRSFTQMLMDNPKESAISLPLNEIAMTGIGDNVEIEDEHVEVDCDNSEMEELERGRGEGLGGSKRVEEEREEEEEEEGQPDGEVEMEVEGEAEDEDEYNLQFEGEMDPLRFAEEDESGRLPYEQFQRLEYEALAARKRKNLAARSTESVQEKKTMPQDIFGASVDEIWDAAGFGPSRRRREPKKRGRKKRRPGASRLTPEVTRKLGEANLLYATGCFDEAVEILKEVVRIAPNVPDSYHTLGLSYDAKGDRKKALNFYMIAAHLTPKDIVLWKRLASWSMEQGNTGQVIYCLGKAMKADPMDVDPKWDYASLYAEMNDFQKATECFEQLLSVRPSDLEVCKMVAKMRQKNGQCEQATQVLEIFMSEYPAEADLTAVNLIAELHMENGAFAAALSQIDRARVLYCADRSLPLELAVKAGICNAYMGKLEDAETNFELLRKEPVDEFADLVLEVGDAYLALGEHKNALRYYEMLGGNAAFDNVLLWVKVAQCHTAIKSDADAIRVYFQVVKEMPENVDARLTLASLLCNCDRHDDAIALLSPPDSEDITTTAEIQQKEQPWWKEGKVLTKLANIYLSLNRLTYFVETILPAIQESLYVESLNQKVKGKKRLPKSVLSARVQWLEHDRVDQVFHGFRPLLSNTDMAKAKRARRRLAKMAADKEERRATILAAGLEWESDEESDEAAQDVVLRVPPLINLLKDEEHYQLSLQVCKTLAVLKRYWEALEIVHHTLRLGNHLDKGKCDELELLEHTLAYADYLTCARSETRVPKHNKFMLQMRSKFPDCTPAMVISGHQFAMISQPQGALREYLQACQLQPDDPFINLCVGVSFINLSLGFRLSNRNQTILQGFAFLYKYQRLCKFSQESNYNLARSFQHVGLVQLAVHYYEKVLAQKEEDRPVVKLPHESVGFLPGYEERENPAENQDIGHCDLRREASHNLHLIYKKSGALDLARQVLRDHCNL